MDERRKIEVEGEERYTVPISSVAVAIGMVVRRFVPKTNWVKFSADKERLINEIVATIEQNGWRLHGPPGLQPHGPIGYDDPSQGQPRS